ncbi:MAG: hypothetical protein JWO62_2641 [Acidimicrobiaceae bacterium]|nr:hypothetical protein [Acidimicrobiaceae bacterium]
MAESVAGAWVDIHPDMTGFPGELRSELDAALSGTDRSVSIDANLRALDAKLAQARTQLASFGTQTAAASIGAQTRDFQTNLGAVKLQLADLARQLTRARIGADSSAFNAELLKMKATLQALSSKDVVVDANIAPAMVKLAALRAVMANMSGDIAMSGVGAGATIPVGSGGSGGGSFWGSLLGGAAGGGGGGGILSKIGWGGGSIGGLAGLGSLGSLMGFGPEHALALGAGLAGSAAGAAAGGGLLAAGSLGTMGVGMGTDLAGIGQAAGDAKNTYAAMTALNTAVATYGKNSQQAAVAQSQLNQATAAFNPIARSAVIATAQMGVTLHTVFNQYTGGAEKIGADILTSLGQVALKFIPTIGQYATQNMGIIQKSLQPLLTWMQSGTGGLGIFTQLEAKFQGELPTAMSAFDQGVQLVAKTIGLASQSTGGFMVKLDAFLTKMNTPAGWSKWSTEVEKLIGDFHTWDAFIVALVRDIAALFHADAGTASSLIQALTVGLDKLHAWETSVAGSSQLHTIFQVHKDQILALLPILGTLISSYGHLMLAVSPALVKTFTALALAVGEVLNAIAKSGPLGTYAIAIALIAGKLSLLPAAFALARGAFMSLAGSAGGTIASILGIGVASETAEGEVVVASRGIQLALGSTGVGLVLVGLGVAATEMMTHWQTVMATITAVTSRMADGIAAAFNAIIRAYNDTIGKLVGQTGAHLSGPSGPAATQTNFSVNSGGMSVPLPAGTSAARAAQLQSLVSSGMTLTQAEASLGGSGPPTVGQLGPTSITTGPTSATAASVAAGAFGSPAAVPGTTGPTSAQTLATNLTNSVNSMLSTLTSLAAPARNPVVAQQTALAANAPAFRTLIANIVAAHQAALTALIPQLVAAHKAALAQLAQLVKAQAVGNQTNAINAAAQRGTTAGGTFSTNATDTAAISATTGQGLATQVADAARVILDRQSIAQGGNTAVTGAQLNLDQVQRSTDATVNAAQLTVDGVQKSTDASVSAAQQQADAAAAGVAAAANGTALQQAEAAKREATANKGLSDAKASQQKQLATANAGLSGAQTEQAKQLAAANAQLAAAQAQQAAAVQLQQSAATMATDVANAMSSMVADLSKIAQDASKSSTDAVTSATGLMADVAANAAQAITDQSAIFTDTLSERGLSGFALQAQQAKVALDQMTATYDQQIGAVKVQNDQANAGQTQLVDSATRNLDQVTTTTQQRVNDAQSSYDATLNSNNQLAQATAATVLAQAKADQQTQIAQAQAALDSANSVASAVSAQGAQVLQGAQDQATLAETQQQALYNKLSALASNGGGTSVVVNMNGMNDQLSAVDALMFELHLVGIG